MKNILLFIFLILIPFEVHTQNFFPMNTGDIFKRYNSDSYYCTGNITYSNISKYSSTFIIADSLVFNGEKYYKVWDKYLHYNNIDKKLYILLYGEKKLAVDFNRITGGDTLYYKGKAMYYQYKGLSQKFINGVLQNCFTISNYTHSGDNFEVIFGEGVGEIYSLRKLYAHAGLGTCFADTTKVGISYRSGSNLYFMGGPPKMVSAEYFENHSGKIVIDPQGFIWKTGTVVERKEITDLNFSVIDTMLLNSQIYYDELITEGKIYLYRMRTKYAELISVPGDTIKLIAISKPENLQQVSDFSGGIKIKWDYNSQLPSRFVIERRPDWGVPVAINFAPIDTVDINIKEYLDTNMLAGAYGYDYRVNALYNDYLSAYSNEIKGLPPVNLYTIHNFSGELIDEDVVNLQWKNLTNLNVNLSVERKMLPTDPEFVKVSDLSNTDTTFVNLVTVANKTYQYRIKTTFGPYTRAYSDTFTIFVPIFAPLFPPANLSAFLFNLTSVKLNWLDTVGNEKQFVIYRGKTLTDLKPYAVAEKNSTSYIDLNPIIYGLDSERFYGIASKNSRLTSSVISCRLMLVGVDDEQIPVEYNLSQNYPNPFNPSTIIQYSLPQRGFVQLKLYDMLGREIATLVNEEKEAGKYSQEFDGTKLTSGFYVYRIISNDFIDSKKMLLIK